MGRGKVVLLYGSLECPNNKSFSLWKRIVEKRTKKWQPNPPPQKKKKKEKENKNKNVKKNAAKIFQG